MPYRVTCCDPCKLISEICGTNAAGWICCFSLVGIVGFFAAGLDIHLEYKDIGSCIDPINPYLVASLVINTLLIIAICTFSLIAVRTDGKFDDCNTNEDCCCCYYRCLAVTIWLLVLAAGTTLFVIGLLRLISSWNCLPIPMTVLMIFSLGFQLVAALVAIGGIGFRAGCIEYVDNDQSV